MEFNFLKTVHRFLFSGIFLPHEWPRSLNAREHSRALPPPRAPRSMFLSRSFFALTNGEVVSSLTLVWNRSLSLLLPVQASLSTGRTYQLTYLLSRPPDLTLMPRIESNNCSVSTSYLTGIFGLT